MSPWTREIEVATPLAERWGGFPAQHDRRIILLLDGVLDRMLTVRERHAGAAVCIPAVEIHPHGQALILVDPCG
jgi:hypothetical protein